MAALNPDNKSNSSFSLISQNSADLSFSTSPISKSKSCSSSKISAINRFWPQQSSDSVAAHQRHAYVKSTSHSTEKELNKKILKKSKSSNLFSISKLNDDINIESGSNNNSGGSGSGSASSSGNVTPTRIRMRDKKLLNLLLNKKIKLNSSSGGKNKTTDNINYGMSSSYQPAAYGKK